MKYYIIATSAIVIMSVFLYSQWDKLDQLEQDIASTKSQIDDVKSEIATFDGKPIRKGDTFMVELNTGQILYGKTYPVNNQFFKLDFAHEHVRGSFRPLAVKAFFTRTSLHINTEQVTEMTKLTFVDDEYRALEEIIRPRGYEFNPELQSGDNLREGSN